MNRWHSVILVAALGLGACGDKEQNSASTGGTQSLKEAGEQVIQTTGSMAGQAGESATVANQTLADKTVSVVKGAADSGAAALDAVQEAVTDAGAEVQSAVDSGAETVAAAVDSTAAKGAAVVAAVAATSVAADDGADIEAGKAVYSKYCVACHGSGAAGAPKLTDKADWQARAAQGTETLNGHAIKGFQGGKGFMPPKGGFSNLSDGDVISAVAYMVSETR